MSGYTHHVFIVPLLVHLIFGAKDVLKLIEMKHTFSGIINYIVIIEHSRRINVLYPRMDNILSLTAYSG